jgi:hypothetical protein
MFNKNYSQRKSQKVWTLLTWVIVITLLLSACGTAQATPVKPAGVIVAEDAQ